MRPLRAALALSGALALSASACASSPHRAASSGADPAAVSHSGADPAAAIVSQSTGTVSGSPDTIVSQGTGTVSGSPDTMTLGVGVQTSAPHASLALASNNSIASALQRALERDGVAASDIQTSNLSLYQGNGAFNADDSVTATIHDLSRAGTIIDDALAAAGDAGQLEFVYFSISDTSPLTAAARQAAVAAARSDAEQLASAAGEKIVALQSLSEVPQDIGGCYGACPFFGAQGVASPSSAAPVPVQPGRQQLSLQVTATWSVEPVPSSGS
jgi:uncharacterized protein YggE